MAVNVVMPHMGESVVEGTITAWLKKPGDQVEEDEPLVEIETDKINVEVPAPAAGVLLEVLAEEGASVEVDQTIAVIGAAGEAAEAEAKPARIPDKGPVKPAPPPEPAPVAAPPAHARPPAAPQAPVPQPVPPRPVTPPTGAPGTPAVAPEMLGVYASPAVRRFAREMGVDLRQVEGTGRMGRLTRRDVQDFLDGKQAAAQQTRVTEAAEAEAPAAEQPRPHHPDVDEELVPLSSMRRAIAEHMVRSKHQAPHVTTVAEVDMTEVAALREAWKPRYAEHDARLTFTAFILHAVARALRDFPDLNAQWTDKGILVKYRINLGLAIAVEDGLVVPVIRDADRLSMLDLARAIEAVAAKTREGKVSPADLKGGTFTITNPGVFGAVISTPIIHQPQAGILAMGRIADTVAAWHGGIAIRKHMFLSLSYDHRIVDGATAVRFLQRVRQILEAADFDMG